ncbi:MAG: PAS domain S-box protein [Cyclobacteriaceae bacterium]
MKLLAAVNQAQQKFILGHAGAAEIFDELLTHVLELTSSEYGFIGRVQYEGEQPFLRMIATCDTHQNQKTKPVTTAHADEALLPGRADTLLGQVLLSKMPLLTHAPQIYRQGSGLPAGHPPLQSFIGIPLISRDRLIGLFGLANGPEGYSEEILQFLEPLSSCCVAIIEGMINAEHENPPSRLHNDYQRLFALNPQPVLVVDQPSLRFLDVNEAALQCYGYSREEFMRLSVDDLWPEEERAKARQEVFSSVREGSLPDETQLKNWKHQRNDGSVFYVNITSHEQTYQGRKVRMIQVHDITEKVLAEEELRQRESSLRAAIDHGMASITLLDTQGRIILTDKSSAALSLQVTGQLMKPGARYADFVPVAEREQHLKHLALALSGEPVRFEREIAHPGKAAFHLMVSYAPVFDDQQEVSSVALSFLDITERRKAQIHLAESEANLQAIFDATSHSYFLLDRNNRILKFNERARQAVRLSHGVELQEGDNMCDYADPQLLESFLKATQKAFTGEKIVNERKVSHPKGERWYEVQYLPVRNKEHEIYGVAFVASDITQHRQTRQALEQAYQRASLMKKALYSSALIAVTDPNGHVVEVNDTFCQTSGYSEAELLGQNLRIVNSSYHPHGFFEEMWSDIKAGKIWRNEIRNKAKDGSIFWLDTIVHPVRNGEGQISKFFSVNYPINERKEAELKITRYAQRMDDILENITDGFFTVDREWRITRVNKVFEKTLRVKREELIGHNLWDKFAAARELKYFPEYHRTMDEGVSTHFTEYFPPLDLWFEANAYPAPDGISVYFRDITQRRKREEEIKKLSQVARRTDNTVIITNAQRQIEWVNEGFTKLTGYELAEVVGKNPGHLLQGPESDPATLARIRQHLEKQEAFTEELINYGKNKEPYWVRMDVNPIINEEGVLEKFIAIQSNITEKKLAEQEKSRLVEDLVSKNQSLEEYAFITSHNLRAPIAHILGLTALFNHEEPSDPFNVTLIRQLRKSADKLDEVVKDLTELLAVRKNVSEVRKEVSLEELMEDLQHSIEDRLLKSKAQLSYDFSQYPLVRTVRGYIYNILLHLIGNAIKYRHASRRPVIRITSYLHDPHHVCISVKDNGLGIDLDNYGHKIFMLYQRFHFHVEGKGFGLHMIKTQAEALGGTVKVESKVNEGSTFKLILPVG